MIQWCHVSVRFRYGGRGDWLHRNVGNISVLNHEGEPMDITQAGVCIRVCTLQTKCKIYAGEHLNQSFHCKQKVKVKTERRSNDGAFDILSDTTRDESTSTHADNGLAYSCFQCISFVFILWPVHSEKKRINLFCVKQDVLKALYFNEFYWWLHFLYFNYRTTIHCTCFKTF